MKIGISSSRFGKTALLMAMAAAAAPAGPPTIPVTTELVQAAQATHTRDQAPATITPPAAYTIRAMLARDTPLMSERRHAIWLGTAKRGNRRSRSRWNYNR